MNSIWIIEMESSSGFWETLRLKFRKMLPWNIGIWFLYSRMNAFFSANIGTSFCSFPDLCLQCTVRFADVKQQTDSFNCGFYALAYSVSLVCNGDPRAEDYMSDQLRRHAYTCIRDGKIQSFPKRSALRKHQGYLWEYQIDIICLCRMPNRKNVIICPTCYDHFHSECISFSSTGIKILSMIFFSLILKFKWVVYRRNVFGALVNDKIRHWFAISQPFFTHCLKIH